MTSDLGTLLSGAGGELGFGGIAGAIVGYTAKKVTKLIALLLGAVFILVQGLVYLHFVSVDWHAVQHTAEHVWRDAQGVTLADRSWQALTANLPFAGGFVAGFALGFKMG
jgi:uncharacterized membrane protein (Fun14 family)